MRRIDKLLNEYGESHQNLTNKAIHWICVPAIFFSIVGLLWSIPVGYLFPEGEFIWLNWAFIALLVVTIYYIRLSVTLSIGMALFAFGCMLLAAWVDTYITTPLWAISISIFVVAWLGQFYGHHVEGKRPSFIKDIQFLLIGPAWLMRFIYRKFRIRY